MLARNEPPLHADTGPNAGFASQNRTDLVRVHVSYRALLRGWAFRPLHEFGSLDVSIPHLDASRARDTPLDMVGHVVLDRTRAIPRETAFAEGGVVPVAEVNNTDSRMRADGRIPFRTNGYVATLLAEYPPIETKHQRINIQNYHRYCKLAYIATFDTDENARVGLERAELTLKMNPGPGIYLAEPLTEKPKSGVIIVDRIKRLGHVCPAGMM